MFETFFLFEGSSRYVDLLHHSSDRSAHHENVASMLLAGVAAPFMQIRAWVCWLVLRSVDVDLLL